MLPLSHRILHTSRKEFLPLHNRGIPIPVQPTTIGGYLRRRRMQLGIFQPEAARILGVSTVSLSRWECDKIYPTPELHPAITAYLGYDPFKTVPSPELKNLERNETNGVAPLSPVERIGLVIKKARLERKLTGKACAKLLGVDPRTLRDWENGKHRPLGCLRSRVAEFLRPGHSATS